jgi:glutathione peroxidase
MSVYDYSARSIDGQQQSLSAWRGQALLIVNVASRCGFTPQYSALETLYRRFGARGFAVLGFPCDQFGHQEPGDEAEIRAFCTTQYQVSFPLFAKIEVKGPNAHPLYRYLCDSLPGLLGLTAIKWNFTKFLISPAGEPVRRFAPADKPEGLAQAISAQLPDMQPPSG